jgi:hypothetical protein
MKRDINHPVCESLSEPYLRSLEDVFRALEEAPRRRRRHFTRTLVGLMAAMLAGCATLPSGELQLGPKIASDIKDQQAGGLASLSRGRPLYLEAYAYPQMLETGDIWAGGPLLVNLGREELSLDQVVGDLGKRDDDQGVARATPAAEESALQKGKKKHGKASAKAALVN